MAEHLPSTHEPLGSVPSKPKLMTFSCMILEEPAWQLDIQVSIHIVAPEVFYKLLTIIEVQLTWLRSK